MIIPYVYGIIWIKYIIHKVHYDTKSWPPYLAINCLFQHCLHLSMMVIDICMFVVGEKIISIFITCRNNHYCFITFFNDLTSLILFIKQQTFMFQYNFLNFLLIHNDHLINWMNCLCLYYDIIPTPISLKFI